MFKPMLRGVNRSRLIVSIFIFTKRGAIINTKWIDLKTYPNRSAIISLLSDCMYANNEAVLTEFEKYQMTASRTLYGKCNTSELIGLIGVEHNSEYVAELKHIAVRSDYRRCGAGREMIMKYVMEHDIQILIAETDKDSMHFYEKIGFAIASLGEKYPGVERFKCTLYVE